LVDDELMKVKEIVGEVAFAAGTYQQAAKLFDDLTANEEFVEFLTLSAYDMI
jgi:malate synthase